MRFMAQAGDGLTQFVPEFVQIVTTQVLQIDILEILPDAFDRVQIRRVAWEAYNLTVSGRSLREEGLDLTIMDRGTIPDDQQLGANLAAQMLEKANHVGAGEGTVLPAQVQLAR